MMGNLLSSPSFTSLKSDDSVALHESIFSHFLFFSFLIPARSSNYMPFFISLGFFFLLLHITHPICFTLNPNSSAHCHIFLIEKLSSSASLRFLCHFSKCIFLKFILSFAFDVFCFFCCRYTFSFFLFSPFSITPLSSFGHIAQGESKEEGKKAWGAWAGMRMLSPFLSSFSFFPSFCLSLTSFSNWKHEKHSFFTLNSKKRRKKSCPKKGKDVRELTWLCSYRLGGGFYKEILDPSFSLSELNWTLLFSGRIQKKMGKFLCFFLSSSFYLWKFSIEKKGKKKIPRLFFYWLHFFLGWFEGFGTIWRK